MSDVVDASTWKIPDRHRGRDATAAGVSAILIVLVVGIVLAIAFMLIAFVMSMQHNDTLETAETQFRASVKCLLHSIEVFAFAVEDAATRLVRQMIAAFESVLSRMQTLLASALSSFSKGISKLLGTIESLALQLFKAVDLLFTQLVDVVINLGTQVTGMIETLPIQIGMSAVLGFANDFSTAIRTIACYVKNGLVDFGENIANDVVADIDVVLNPVISFFKDPAASFQTYVIGPMISDLESNILDPIESAIKTPIQEIASIIGDIEGAINDIENVGGVVIQKLGEIYSDVKNGAIDAANTLASGATSVANSAESWFESWI